MARFGRFSGLRINWEKSSLYLVDRPEDTLISPSSSLQVVDRFKDVDEKVKVLMGAGRRNMVMKDIRAAVNAFQEASSLLGKKYGETADQCADAFFSYGIALLELARVENGVLGNALEGMPEDEDDGEKAEDPNIPSAANLDEKEREQLRDQVYEAMAEKEEKSEKDTSADKAKAEGKEENGDVSMEEDKKSSDKETTGTKTNGEAAPAVLENGDQAEKKEAEEKKETTEALSEDKGVEASKSEEKGAEELKEEGTVEVSKTEEKSEEESKPEKAEAAEKTEASAEEGASKEHAAEEAGAKPEGGEKHGEDSKPEDEPMEGEEGEDAEDAESEDGEENEETEEKDEDEVGNLQLSWEMLELAKVIYKRQEHKEAKLKAAQAHLKLGEVGVESENYTQAVEDFQACLDIQKEHLEAHDRLLAETCYQLGLAYHYCSKHEEAISQFTKSIEVIEQRMAMLTDQIEKAAGESTEELQKEMDELKGLLPDIKEKIEDSKEAQKTDDATEKALKETLVGSSAFAQENGSTSTSAEKSGDSTVPVTNCISHLVRKRKPEGGSPQKDAKKCKAEPVANGSGNGDAVVPTNEEADEAKTQAEKQTPMETTAVESSA
ncbi:nuclear autoantigenic sperm protein [Gastrophryne carolinensis]